MIDLRARMAQLAEVRETAVDKMRAAIASDGSLNLCGRKARFRISLSDNRKDLVTRKLIPLEDLLGFLRRFVVEAMDPLSIEAQSGHPKIIPCVGHSYSGKPLPGVTLGTLSSELLTDLYHEYYPKGKKTISESFSFTAPFLAWFFMFDGNSKWYHNGGSGVEALLFTQGLDIHSIEFMELQLHGLGVNTNRNLKTVGGGAGIILSIPIDSVNHFMHIIDPYVILPYRYKIKYIGDCPIELLRQYKESHSKN